jgi:hypothetical protein
MKRFFLLIGMFLLLAGFVSLDSQAQEAERPNNFWVLEEFVSPSDVPAFREAQSEAIRMWKKHDWDVPFFCYQNDNNAYYWVVPIKNFGSIDVIHEKMTEIGKKMKDDGFDINSFRDLSTMRHSVIHWEEDLSYHPSGSYGQTTDNRFVEWTFCYLKAGHQEELAAAIKKYMKFYDGIPESFDWDVYTVVFGHDTPCLILMTRAESELAMKKLESDMQSKYKEDFQKLWGEFTPHVRKFENIKGWFMPRWSMNIPE